MRCPIGPRACFLQLLTLRLLPSLGRTRFDRLIFIGKTCVPLCVDALKAAVNESKKGLDVSRYRESWDCIRIAAPDEPEAQRDDAWIEKTETGNRLETARLETELKGYKNNLIKESIRVRAHPHTPVLPRLSDTLMRSG